MYQRKRNRLLNYDYSSNGAYFITFCTEQKINMLSDIVENKTVLKFTGTVAEEYIKLIEGKFNNVFLDKYIIMPNHIHLLIRIDDFQSDKKSSNIIDIIGWLKYSVTKVVNAYYDSANQKLFQRSFHDRVIRDEEEYHIIADYIQYNPQKWSDDVFFN